MQISGSLGQEIFKGQRIQKEVNNRTLPHFFQNDDTSLARGLIENSYLQGLSPQEFFFHHMSGREGLIDTAIKTADTGYISRKLMKGLEDIYLSYDGTVRTSNGIVTQYIYSDFNLNHTKQKKLKLKSMIMGNKSINEEFSFNKKEIDEVKKKTKLNLENINKINNLFVNGIKKYRDMMRRSQKLINLNYKILISEFYFPINFVRLIEEEKFKIVENDNNEFCSPEYILDKINYLLKPEITQLITFNKSILNNKNSVKLKDEERSKKLFKYSLYEFLCPKKVIFEYKFSKANFDNIIDQIIYDFKLSQVEPGEMVGCLAAQHIGEPSTQMTLNTFHATGSGSKAMQGVPRVEELTRATKNIKTPEMSIYLKEEIKKDRDKVNIIASNIMYTTISDVMEEYEVIYDLNTKEEAGFTKLDKVSIPFYISIKNTNENFELMPWLLRIKLDRNKMIENNVTTLEIKTNYIKFLKSYFNDIKTLKRLDKQILSLISSSCILSNFDNNDQPVIHIRFEINDFNYDTLLSLNEWILDNFKLKGIESISNINIASDSRLIEYDEDQNVIEGKENVIFTEGINMEDIRYVPNIDLNRTYCNEINTINKYFGIEAARSSLLKEIAAVYNDYSLNYHHLTILTDAMTNMGVFTSIDRHGINKLDTDPLSRASFEMPIEQLIKAAVHNEVDTMRSVSSRIMAGRVFGGGTGACDLLLDTDLVMNSEYIEDEDALEKTLFNFIEPNDIIIDILKRKNFNIFRPDI